MNLNISASRQNIKFLVSNFGAFYVGNMHTKFQLSSSTGKGGDMRKLNVSPEAYTKISNYSLTGFTHLGEITRTYFFKQKICSKMRSKLQNKDRVWIKLKGIQTNSILDSYERDVDTLFALTMVLF